MKTYTSRHRWCALLLVTGAVCLALAGCGGGTSDSEDAWGERIQAEVSPHFADLGRIHREIGQLLLEGARRGSYNNALLATLIADAKQNVEAAKTALGENEAPTERTRELATLVESGLRHYREGIYALERLLDAEFGSLQQIQLGDAADQQFVQAQRDFLSFGFRVLEIGDLELSTEAQDALRFLEAYNRAEDTYYEASAVDNDFLRALEDEDSTPRLLIERAKAAREALQRYREELVQISKPVNQELAVDYTDLLNAVDDILESYDLAISGLRSLDRGVLVRSDKKRSEGFLALSSTTLEIQNDFAALLRREAVQ